MMIQAVRLTRKKAALAVILAGAVMAALILLLGRRRQSGPAGPSPAHQQCGAGGLSAGIGLGSRSEEPVDHPAISAAAHS